MPNVKITIDGRQVEVDSSMTILQAAHSIGITDIPTLCFDGRLEPFASCFICVVKIEGRQNLVASCATPVSDGMVITTDNDEIRSARKAALELLLSNHYADCIAPCKLRCPSNVDVQGYIALLSAGEIKEAVKLHKTANPFMATCGRVCVRPCEDVCRRNKVDERIGIAYLKRYIIDANEKSGDPYITPKCQPTGKKVAIVGAGPAGLSCAFYLAQMGHEVEVFEEKPKPGGMLRYGIPEYRLPKSVLDTEIAHITELVVKINYEKKLGRDFTVQDLKNKYDAVFIGIGCQTNRPLEIPGENSVSGFLSGIEFLEQCQRGICRRVPGKVLVIGGGNTAIDCARTCIRMGADKVTLVYRRSRKEMPAHPSEVDAAEHEGVELMFLAAPKRVIDDGNNKLKGVEFVRMELGEPDASGRRRPVEVKGSEFVIECDWAIAAVGQVMDENWLQLEPEQSKPALSKWRTLFVDEATGATNIDGVFAGGDDVSGAATAIEAIAAGKKSAHAIHSYLMGQGIRPLPEEFVSRKDTWGDPPKEDFADIQTAEKQRMPELDVKERVKNFAEVELGFDKEMALKEAGRCLECGCVSVYKCLLKEFATQYKVDVGKYLGEVKKHKVDKSHPFIHLDMNKCILCGRCVRICSDEFVGANALGFVRRGFETVMKPALEKPLLETTCESCGMCISTCPTGAIESVKYTPKPGPFKLEYTDTVCGYCSAGCELKAGKIGSSLVEMEIPDDGMACFKGRFGASYNFDPKRISKPKLNGKATKLSLALETIASEIMKIGDKSKLAIFVSPRLTCETMIAISELARAIGTNMVGSLAQICDDTSDGVYLSTATYDDLSKADAILLVDGNISDTHPAIAYRIINSVWKGSKLVVLSAQETKLTRLAANWLKLIKGNYAIPLGTLAGIVSEYKTSESTGIPVTTIDHAKNILKNAKQPVIIYSADRIPFSSRYDNSLIHKIANDINAKVLLAIGECNYNGLVRIFPEVNALRKKVFKKEISAILSFGEDPIGWMPEIFEEANVIAAMDLFPTATTKKAKILLPMASLLETTGTYIDAQNSLKKLNSVFTPSSEIDNYHIVATICELLGHKIERKFTEPSKPQEPKIKYPSEADILGTQPTIKKFPEDSLIRWMKKFCKEKLGK